MSKIAILINEVLKFLYYPYIFMRNFINEHFIYLLTSISSVKANDGKSSPPSLLFIMSERDIDIYTTACLHKPSYMYTPNISPTVP